MKKYRMLLAVCGLVGSLLACNLLSTATTQAPVNIPQDLNVATSVARTLAFDSAVLTAVASAQAQSPGEGVVLPTNQPPAATSQPTSDKPMISASMDTNCRKGPSTIYEAISYLLVGKTSEVVNQYQNGLWWVIKDPNDPGQRCWVWGQTTTVTGNWQALPEATQPPTPTVQLVLETELTTVDPPNFLGLCPATLNLGGTITTNMPVNVSYVWARSSGPNLGSGSVSFAAAGTQNISFHVNFLGPSSGDITIRIVAPISVTSNSMHYSIHCTP